MERNFSPDEWKNLTAGERIELCETLARESQQLARGPATELRAAFREISSQWLAMARVIEGDTAR